MKLKYIPNILSAARIVMAIAFALVFVLMPERLYAAVVIFVAAGITDIVDGFLARRFGWITDLGKILDPVADKLMQLVSMFCLFFSGLIPWWMLVPIIMKEITMGIGSLIFYKKANSIGVSAVYGKAYTVLFYVVVAAILVFNGWFSSHVWIKYVLCAATAVMGWTAIVLYYITYLKGKLLTKGKAESFK